MIPLRCILALTFSLLIISACRQTDLPQPTASPTTDQVVIAEPTLVPELTMTPSQAAAEVEVYVFFTHRSRYAQGIQPFEEPVLRKVPIGGNLPEFVLNEFFKGPTPEEITGGVDAITSGFTGFSSLVIQDGIARVRLEGSCSSNGATYTIAQPLMRNLLQFEEIRFIKIFDEQGMTDQPDGETNSIPICLQP